MFLYRAVDKYVATIDFLFLREILKLQKAFSVKKLERMESQRKSMSIRVELINQFCRSYKR